MRKVIPTLFVLSFFSLPAQALDTPIDLSLAPPDKLGAAVAEKPGSSTVVLHVFSWELPADAQQYAGEDQYLVIVERKLPTDKQFKKFTSAAVFDQTVTVAVNASKNYTYRARTFLGARKRQEWKYSPYSGEFRAVGGGLLGPVPPGAWNQRFGADAEGKSVSVDNHGNLALGGLTYEPLSLMVGGQPKSISPGSFVAKYDLTGGLLWANALGSDMPTDPDIRVASDPWGNVLSAVEFAGSNHFDSLVRQTARKQDVMLIKHQGSDGRVMWSRKIGGNGNDGAHALLADYEGNWYVGGYFDAPPAPCAGQGVDFGAGEVCGVGAGKALAFLVKYNADGAFQWVVTSLGVSIFDLALEESDHLVASSVTGSASSECSQELHGRTLELTRVALADGATTTVRSLPWPTSQFNICNRGYPIAVAANNDIILSGEFTDGVKLDDQLGSTPTVQTSADFNRESFIARYTAAGKFVWGKKFGNLTGDPSNCQFAIAMGLSLAENGDVLVSGVFRGVLEFSSQVKVSQESSVDSGFFAARYSGAGKALAVTDLNVNQSCSSAGADILGLPGGYAAVTGVQDRFRDIRAFVSVYVP